MRLIKKRLSRLCFLPILAPSLGGRSFLHRLSILRNVRRKEKKAQSKPQAITFVDVRQERGSETRLPFYNSLRSRWKTRKTGNQGSWHLSSSGSSSPLGEYLCLGAGGEMEGGDRRKGWGKGVTSTHFTPIPRQVF